MIDFIIPMIERYFSSGMYSYWLVPVLALSFIAAVPCIIRKFFK